MRYTYIVGSYNTRRFGKPWIARVVTWDVGKNPVLDFGAAIDDHEAEIEAEPGSVIRYGQKDHRNPRGTTNEWAIAMPDGTLRGATASECRQHWAAGCPVPREDTGDNVVRLRP